MKKKISFLLLAFILSIASCSFISKNFDTSDRDKLVIQLITYMLEEAHYLDKKIDDNFSSRVFENFIENLDPYKRYFYLTDIEEFRFYKTSIDDFFKEPNLDFFELVYKRYKQRIGESKSVYKEILKKPFNFSIDEEIDLDNDNLEYVKSEFEMNDRWRKLLKLYVIENYHDDIEENKNEESHQLKSFSEIEKSNRDKIMTTMDESFRFIEEELQRDYWFSIYINSFVSEFDPNSSYLDPESRERFDVDMSGNYAGIGARLQKKVDKIEITEVISGGPAWRENKLTSGDIILKVRQENEIEPVSILGMRLADAVKLIKGEKGTKVFLTIKKVDGTVNEVSIKRDIVLLEETYIKSSLIQNNGRNYGLINIPKFYIDFDNQNNKDAAKDLREEIKRLKNMNIKGLLVDLRNNGGGSLKTVVDMVGMFIKNGPVVQVKYPDNDKQILYDRDRSIEWEGPLVILVNENSASASEIMAAALQDYNRAIVIGGDQTWGKGTVQNVYPLNRMVRGNTNGDLGALRYTTQKYYRINGGSVQLEGVKSDIVVPYKFRYLDFGEKDYDNPLKWDEIQSADFQLWESNFSFKSAIDSSKSRIESNKYLTIIDKNAKWIKKIRDNKSVNLNYKNYKNDLKINNEKLEQLTAIDSFSSEYQFASLPYELNLIKNDSVLGQKRNRWHKILSKDIYIDEALHVLNDLLDSNVQ